MKLTERKKALLLLVIEPQPYAIKEVQKHLKLQKYLMRYIFVKWKVSMSKDLNLVS